MTGRQRCGGESLLHETAHILLNSIYLMFIHISLRVHILLDFLFDANVNCLRWQNNKHNCDLTDFG